MEAFHLIAKQIACPVVLIIKKSLWRLFSAVYADYEINAKRQYSEKGRAKLLSHKNMITDKIPESFGNGNKIKSAYL